MMRNRSRIAEILAVDEQVKEEQGSVKRARELLKELDAARALLEWHIHDPNKTFLAEGPVISIIGGLGEVIFMAIAENKSTRPGLGRVMKRIKR